MSSASVIGFVPPVQSSGVALLGVTCKGGLKGSEYTWALAFLVPYIGVFCAFVVYPALLRALDGQPAEPLCRTSVGSDLPEARW